ncbi:MAG TPA: signal peptidase I [Methylomirabilota bacterium]|nr:signal peptidase I [Methylomirabilota bacterium]
MSFVRWLTSGTVRKAVQLRKSIERVLHEQEDLLTPEAQGEIRAANDELQAAIRSGAGKTEILSQMKKVENVAINRFRAYPNAVARENVKEFLVAVVVIFGFTTFFLQLTKIPTGSMQPTLFGITHQSLMGTDTPIPNFIQRFGLYWTKGIQHFHLVAKVDGELEAAEEPKTVFPFIKRQRFRIGGVWHTLWFVPDDIRARAELAPGVPYRAGQDVIKLRVNAGDHLLIDRFTYNFRRPNRGEIIVFKTRGIEGMSMRAGQGDQLYIKRLVGMPGEKVTINDQNHLVIDGRELTASDRHFEHVYGYNGETNPAYIGHANQKTAVRLGVPQVGAYHFESGSSEPFEIRPKHYLAMGDNTLASWDSRSWGDLPQENVIGRAFFVYWPITDRFGWGYR